MMFSDRLRELEEQGKRIASIAMAMQQTLSDAAKDWPDHQVVPGAKWRTRDETPPVGAFWASDGLRVWLLTGNGEPISPGATAVKYWTDAFIPAPPVVTLEPGTGYQIVADPALPPPSRE